MAKWSAGSETGILRKRVAKDKFDDLLIFGYACKIFRDDEKALYIDKGKHLIPWMGDSTLKIDRYDCRGALADLTPYEGSDHDASQWMGLSETERRLELRCDEERYYALKYNEEELEMYQEEATKRLLQKSTDFQYNYDVPINPEHSEDIVDTVEQDEAFEPPPELNIPADMEVPKTVKEHTRIEKTAMFVSSQGPQMEILIKTKQGDNPQFSFMNKEDQFYKYYKFLLTAIKSGQYKVQLEVPTIDTKTEDTNEHEEHDGHYLHPSLVTPTSVQPAQLPPPLPTVTYKPSADCTYSQLVSRIQGTQSDSTTTTPPPLPSQDVPPGQMTYEQQQYYQQYYYAAQYYEYYKQMAEQFTGPNVDNLPSDGVQDPEFSPEQFYALCQNQSDFQGILQSHAAYQQYMQQQQPSNSYAQLVSNLSQTQNKETSTGPISELPVLNDISKAPILYTKPEQGEQVSAPIIGPQLPITPVETEQDNNKKEKCTVKQPLLSLAQYGSDSEEESDEEESGIKIPPSDLQQIIDKMAVYVSKNGKDFESIVRAKGDIRFHFLNAGHEFNPYYKMKLGEKPDSKMENGITDKLKEKKVIAPVSFSIKKPKDELPKEIKSALPVEESDEEHEDSTTPPVPATIRTPLAVETTTLTLLPETTSPTSLTPPLKEIPKVALITTTQESIEDIPDKIPENNMDNTKPNETVDLILDMIEITENIEERRESKRVENIKKDKITAAMKERIALQLERKKKAAAFLKLKSSVPPEVAVKNEKSVETSKPTIKSEVSKVVSDSKLKESNIGKGESSVGNTGVHDVLELPKETKPKETIIEIIHIEDSDLEEGEIKKHKKHVKKKKSHKRKRSKSKHRPKHSHHKHKSKEHKKSKKRRKKSESSDSDSSESS